MLQLFVVFLMYPEQKPKLLKNSREKNQLETNALSPSQTFYHRYSVSLFKGLKIKFNKMNLFNH